jgi:dTDP-glucose 4,6-dehydratase
VKRFPQADLEHAIGRAVPAWDALRGARLLVTGATGFFGSWLLETVHLARLRLGLDLELTFLSRDPGAFLARHPHLSGFEAIQGDVRTLRLPARAFSHVIHGATSASAAFNQDAPEEMFGTILDGTRRLLEELAPRPPARLLFLSSGAVYGPQPRDLPLLAESFPGGPDPLDPGSAYAEGKRAAEHAAALWARRTGTRLVVARPFAFVGPGLPLDLHFAVGNFLRDALAGRPIRVKGDGTPLRSYLHAADLAAWLLRLLAEGEPGQAYNVGSDQAVSIAGLAGEIARIAGAKVIIEGRAPEGVQPLRYVPDISRARALGLEVSLDRSEALRRTLEWLRSPEVP